MQLNHLDLQVPNVVEAAAFFERHFQFEVHGNRRSPAIAILEGEGGFVLVLQRKRDAAEVYPEGFHIGFLVADEAQVHEKHAAMLAAGVEGSAVQRNARGVMFYCHAPGGILIEVSHRPRGLPPVRGA